MPEERTREIPAQGRHCSPSRPGAWLWLWYAPFEVGGVGTFLLQAAREFSRRGIPMTVAATASAAGALRQEYGPTEAAILDWSRYRSAFYGRLRSDDIVGRIERDVFRLRPGVIVINDCGEFGIGARRLLERLRPFCVVLDVAHADPPNYGAVRWRALYGDVLDGIAVTTRAVVPKLRFWGGALSRLPARYIPNGVPSCPPRGQRTAGPLRLLYAGRLVAEFKRAPLIASVAAALRGADVPFELTVAGDGAERDRLEARIREQGLCEVVRFEGEVTPSRVQELYRSHDLLLSVSDHEGFSFSLLEAMAAGCVPVCTDLPSLDRSVFVDSESCLLLPVDKVEVAVERLRGLTNERLQELSVRAQEVTAGLTPTAMVDGYIELAEDVRRQRRLEAWPSAPIRVKWSPAGRNPWIPRASMPRRALGWLRTHVCGRE